MHIFMISTRLGVEDGFAVRLYRAGMHYDAADGLAAAFINAQAALAADFNPLTEGHSHDDSLP